MIDVLTATVAVRYTHSDGHTTTIPVAPVWSILLTGGIILWLLL